MTRLVVTGGENAFNDNLATTEVYLVLLINIINNIIMWSLLFSFLIAIIIMITSSDSSSLRNDAPLA